MCVLENKIEVNLKLVCIVLKWKGGFDILFMGSNAFLAYKKNMEYLLNKLYCAISFWRMVFVIQKGGWTQVKTLCSIQICKKNRSVQVVQSALLEAMKRATFQM